MHEQSLCDFVIAVEDHRIAIVHIRAFQDVEILGLVFLIRK